MTVDASRPWVVHAGDCRVALAAMDAESVDACVTDTPYGLSTLLDPPNLDRESLWRRLTAGEVKAPIVRLLRAWLDDGENPTVKGRGFMGKEWDALVPPPNTWRAVWRVLKPGACLLAFAGARTDDLVKMSIRLAGFEIDDGVQWWYGQGMPKRVRLDLKIDQHFGKARERPVLGRHPAPNRNNGNKTMGDGWVDAPMLTGAATTEAAVFVGYDRALRPSCEPIVLARKPLRGTIAETALAHGTGGLHVDACRIPRNERGEAPLMRQAAGDGFGGYGAGERRAWDERGGYPANVVIDEAVAAMLDEQAVVRKSGARAAGAYSQRDRTAAVYGASAPREQAEIHGSEGGASRFFYTAKASSSERDKGLESLPPLTAGERCDREDGSLGINGYAGTNGAGGRNPHPTVKPISLMRWLVRLASPPGAWDPDPTRRPVVLDPFAGSGSTLVAGLAEGVRVVGCELDPDNAHVARLRCQHAYALPREEAGVEVPAERNAAAQRTLF